MAQPGSNPENAQYMSGRREVTMDPIHNSRCKPVLTGNFIKFHQIIFDVWIQLTLGNSKELFQQYFVEEKWITQRECTEQSQ